MSNKKENMSSSNEVSKKIKHSSVWIFLSQGGGQLLRFISNLIMTRLLFEEAFGIMTIVNVFILGLKLFSDFGFGPSIIQNKRGNQPDFYNTAWTMQVIRGFFLFSLSLLGAIPFSNFYNEPILAKIISVAGFSTVISGFNSTKIFTYNRNLELKRVALIEFSSQLSGIILMVLWGFYDRSVWALVVGSIMTSISKMILSHCFLKGESNRFCWKKEDARSLFNFGRWIFLSTIITFFAQQSDRLIFGKMIPLSLLGIYHIAFTLGNIPLVILKKMSGKIFFPLLSRINENREKKQEIFHQIRLIILLCSGWALSGLIAGGSAIVELLYDDRYLQAGWIVQLVSIGFWFNSSMDSYGALLLSYAKTKQLAFSNFIKFISMVTFILLGNHLFGFTGAIVGIIVSELFRLIIISLYSARLGYLEWKIDILMSLKVAVISSIVAFLDNTLKTTSLSIYLRVIIIFTLITIAWLPLGRKVYHGTKKTSIFNGVKL